MRTWLACLVIAAATVFVYRPLLDDGVWQFISHWDDEANFLDNDAILGFSYAHIRLMFTARFLNIYEPVALMFKALVVQLRGGVVCPQAMRLASLGLHTANACLLLCCASFILEHVPGRDRDRAIAGGGRGPSSVSWGSLYAALLYAIHPVNVEVVAWPSAQSYAVAGFFSLLSIRAYLCQWGGGANHRPGSNSWLCRRPSAAVAVSAALYLLAVLGKSAAVLLPVAFPLLDLALLPPPPPPHGAALPCGGGGGSGGGDGGGDAGGGRGRGAAATTGAALRYLLGKVPATRKHN